MNATELLADFSRRGISLKVDGEYLDYDAGEGVMQPTDLEQLRTHKAELLKALTNEASAGAEEQLIDAKAPENEAVAMLRQHPELSYTFVTDERSDPDHVIMTVAIRNKATCKLRIAKDKYDGLGVLEWIEQRTSGKPQ